MHCIMPQGQTTPEKTLSNPWYGKGFCEANQYKAAIDRCEGGYKSLELGIDIYRRFHKLMENHSAAIREWSNTSQKHIAESKEFGTNKKSWLSNIRAMEKLAEQNDAIAAGVQHKAIDEMNNYKNQFYGKSFVHVKQIKEFESEFKKVQRTWLDCLEKVNDAKQEYHDAQSKLKSAKRAEKALKDDVGSAEDQRDKAEASVKRRTSSTEKYKTRYQTSISDMKSKQDKYQTDMLAILKKTDEFERKRLEHFKKIIVSLQEVLIVKHEEFDSKLLEAFTKAIGEHNTEEDIKYFNTHYGSGTKTNWPDFEDCSE